jgi:hypothetical protein
MALRYSLRIEITHRLARNSMGRVMAFYLMSHDRKSLREPPQASYSFKKIDIAIAVFNPS